MGTGCQKRQYKSRNCRWQRGLAAFLVLCLLLTNFNLGSLRSYATENHMELFEIGADVTAELEDGVLTVRGYGDTDDFEEDTAPFSAYADEIHTLVIEDGITYIGAYLFYNLGNLEGELILPASIVGFGDYAFSGDSRKDAPGFSVIRNEFEECEVVQQEEEDTAAEETTPATPSDADEVLPKEKKEDIKTASASNAQAAAEDSAIQETEEEEDPFLEEELINDLLLSYMTQQDIENPDTLFYEGQTGAFFCSEDNTTFVEAAESAGYQMADRFVHVTLDGLAEMELPAWKNRVMLPECPDEIENPYDDNAFYTSEFAGWIEDDDDSDTVLEAGTLYNIHRKNHIYLSSAWKMTGRYHLGVSSERNQDIAVYTLTDVNTGQEPEIPFGYTFLYQWQIAEKGVDASAPEIRIAKGHSMRATSSDAAPTVIATSSDADPAVLATASDAALSAEDGWTDIPGADASFYERNVEPDDTKKQFRCMVTAVSLLRSAAADEEITLYSDAVVAAPETVTVYVDQDNGSDKNTGTKENPVQSLSRAAAILTENPGGTMDSNQVILLSDYKMDNTSDSNLGVPLTIQSEDNNSKKTISGMTESIEGNKITLNSDIGFENVKLSYFGHLYGNSNNITVGEYVENEGEFYLYAGDNSALPFKEAIISIFSGKVTRIACQARSTSTALDAKHIPIYLNVGGTAYIKSIIAGNANAGVSNANVHINVTGGNVVELVGGCQGHQTADADYTGQTSITVSGGEVTNIYGAGSGRSGSVPTFKGTLDIKITGGTVTNIYGSGSSAYVVSSDTANPSQVNITASGGTIENIYTAGLGGAKDVTPQNNGIASLRGSLTGDATVTVEGTATVGNLYASGHGYKETGENLPKENAFLNGNVTINMKGGTAANIYGGGMGIEASEYEECGSVKEGSQVWVNISGGTVTGNVYGGGKSSNFHGDTLVTVSGTAHIAGNVYGGGESGLVTGRSQVNIEGGTIGKSVYGGALGVERENLVRKGSTVNMTGGWIKGNLYGGSERSNDGASEDEKNEIFASGRIFVNLIGGNVSGNVYGGSYKGEVFGSTHLHIGKGAIGKCKYYQSHQAEGPELTSTADLTVNGSVYAGGDYGVSLDGTMNYDTITVHGYSHVYIDGTGYAFNQSDSRQKMKISGGVFGSGASCDAGDVRLVTLDHYGARSGNEVSSTLTSIQRADQVRLISSHVHLTGQSDVANDNQTALYSLNRIGDRDTTNDASLAPYGKSLVLADRSTMILDSAAIEVANFKSIKGISDSQEDAVALTDLSQTPNTIVLTTGTVFRVAHTVDSGNQYEYGQVMGYTYMIAGDTAEAYAYARIDNTDGGFADVSRGEALPYTDVTEQNYRYWKVMGDSASVVRNTVLTAVTKTPATGDGYSVAEGEIELPPAEAGSVYTIKSVSIPNGVTLVEGAKDSLGEWSFSRETETETSVTAEIDKEPLKKFGLYMHPGQGFDGMQTSGMVVSSTNTVSGDADSIIGKSPGTLNTSGSTPMVDFYLTYQNAGMIASQDLGPVVIELERKTGEQVHETITMNVHLVTKATSLTEQTINLYATSGGSFTGKLIIPAGANRTLSLSGVTAPEGKLVAKDQQKGEQFAITMQPESGPGWPSADLEMQEAYDLSQFASTTVDIGTTDGRYEAPIQITLFNDMHYTAKDTADEVILTLKDANNAPVNITLKIHWIESIVSELKTSSGKQYNGFTNTSVQISKSGAFTTDFKLSSAESVNALWLELRKSDSETDVSWPAGTKLTLMGSSLNNFYYYETTGAEEEGKIYLSEFKQMWEETKLTSNIAQQHLTILVEFEQTKGLEFGDYTLRLRNETGADSKGAAFTVGGSNLVVSLSEGEEAQNGIYTFTLSITPNQDTHYLDGAAAVLHAGTEVGFSLPDGVIFRCDNKTYVPVNGRVYLPFDFKGTAQSPYTYEITMDTSPVPELAAGAGSLTADIFAIGKNAGSSTPAKAGPASFTISANPEYGIRVSMAEGESRVVSPGTQRTFHVDYNIYHTNESATIGIKVQKKENDSYTDISDKSDNWSVSGNQAIQPSGGSASGWQPIEVIVPSGTEAGTYRLVFTLGDRTAVYNIIVQQPTV